MSKIKSKLFIIGLGSTAEEIRLFVEKYDIYDIAGFAVNQQYISSESFHGYPVYAIEKLNDVVDKEKDFVFVALFWNHLNNDRRKLYEALKVDGYRFATLISPKCEINQSQVGENCWIADSVYIKPTGNTEVDTKLKNEFQDKVLENDDSPLNEIYSKIYFR